MSDRWAVHHGDCREVMQAMDADSVDSVVSDPPYGLSFMGKGWDHGVPGVEFWEAALRVAKPGCHLLAFGGTRTFHRLTVAIEDAGWDIRDCLMWVYGSGFPKSLDVSKAIDKMDASEEQERRRLRFTAWVRSTGVTSRQIDEATGTNMGGHYTTAASQPAIMTREHLEACRHILGDVPDWVEREADIRSVESRNMAEREVVGVQKNAMSGWDMDGGTRFADRNITAPATDAARQWQGWGTALKPAWEPIILARKPLSGTVAANVLEHGTGAINVDGCRVEFYGEADKAAAAAAAAAAQRACQNQNKNRTAYGEFNNGPASLQPYLDGMDKGRWPANLIHDGSEEVAAGFPDRKGATSNSKTGVNEIYSGGWGSMPKSPGRSDSGTAARFFYCAKASKRDRDEGCEGLEEREAGIKNDSGRGYSESDPMAKIMRSNHHPTVKPTDLMRYLCRLITPPDGLVFDPFTGSGSTGKAAMLEGFRFVGAELSPEYIEIARARIGHAAGESKDARATQGNPRQKELVFA